MPTVVEAFCSQCTFKVKKAIEFDGVRSEAEQVREAVAGDLEGHEHPARFIRVSWAGNERPLRDQTT